MPMHALGAMLLLVVCLHSSVLAADAVELSVTVGQVRQHEATHVGIEIVNQGQHPVLLHSIRVLEADATYTWEEQVYGSLSYSEGDDAFIHNRMAQMASQLKLGPALVRPGASAQHAMPLTLDESGPGELTVVLSYNVIDSDKLAARIYVSRDTSPLEARYTPATLKELSELGAPGPVGGLSTLFVTRDLPRPRQAKTRVALTVAEAEFPLQEALQRVAVTAHEYDAESEAWWLDTRGGMWIVTRQGAEFVPGLGAKEQRFIDDTEESVPFWFLMESLPEDVRDEVEKRIARYEPEEGMGVHLDVPTGDVRALAAEVAGLGLRLELSDFQLTPMLSIRPITD
jgi:hypothetical protein